MKVGLISLALFATIAVFLAGCGLAQSLGLGNASLPVVGTVITEAPKNLTVDGVVLKPVSCGTSQHGRPALTPTGGILYGGYNDGLSHSPNGGTKQVESERHYVWRPSKTPEPISDVKFLLSKPSSPIDTESGRARCESILNANKAAWEAKLGTEGTYAQWDLYAATPDFSVISGIYRSKTDDVTKQKRVDFVYREGIGFEDTSPWFKAIAAKGGIKLPSYADDTSSFHTMPEHISADGTTITIGEPAYMAYKPIYVIYNPAGFGPKGKCLGIGAHELGLQGTASSVNAGRWTVTITGVIMPDGKTTPLAPPRSKVILIPKELTLPTSVKAGTAVRIIGADAGKGRPLTARIIDIKK